MTPSEVVTTYRPLLFSIAYRMIGEVMVSEDIVQDVLLNWLSQASETPIRDDKAYLVRSVVNGSLNYLARVKREREAYRGVWLPEPVVSGNPVVDARLDITYGFMLLLEKLSPLERAVFILKESFDVDYSEVAQLFAITEANGRQLYRRAKQKIAESNRRVAIDPPRQQALLEAFAKAGETGNIDPLIQLLKTDVVLYSDGGGKVPAALKPLVGFPVVANFLRSLASKHLDQLRVRLAFANGEVALLFTQTDSVLLSMVLVIEVDSVGISRLYSIRNPDKLAHLR